MTYSVSGNNIRNLREYLHREEKISFQDFDNILRDAQDIFSRCLPLGEHGAIKGLIYGHVQSGKTAIILTTMALAADNGCRNFIVLTSNINDLYDQTLGRIKKSLDGFEVLGKKDFQRYSGFDVDTVRVLVSSKHGKTLEKVANLSLRLGWQNESTFIIDDEADQASLNTNINKPEKGVSKINHQITSIRQTLQSCTYLQTTATPQALLLQDKNSNFRPDFVVSTTAGSGYIGGNHYFINDESTEISPHIRIVPTIDPDNLRTSNSLPDSIALSIVTFFLGSAVLRLKGNTKKYTYLLHTSFKQADHSVMFRLVDEFRNELAIELNLTVRSPSAGSSAIFSNYLDRVYTDLSNTFEDIPNLQEIIREVVHKIASTEVIEANSFTKQGVKPEPDRQHTLYIGGTKMSRGVTFKNLLVTYYGRDSQTPQIDTVLQHARMYGYRSGELPAIRIYLPQNLSNRFSDIHISDNIMREKCRSTHAAIPIIPLMSRNLKPTRGNVLSNLTVDLGTYYGGVEYFPLLPVSDPSILKNQTEIIDNLLSTYKDKVPYEMTIDQLFYILSPDFFFAASDSPGAWRDDLIREALSALKSMPKYGDRASLLIYNRKAKIGKVKKYAFKALGAVIPERSPNNIVNSLPRDRPALILTRNDGKVEITSEGINKGWDNHPFWIPLVRFPEGNYAFSVNYS